RRPRRRARPGDGRDRGCYRKRRAPPFVDRAMSANAELGAHRDERHYLEERYREDDGGRSRALNAYYALKPLLPRRLQIAMRRAYARRQQAVEFPRWPQEPLLVERREAELRQAIERRGGEPVPLLADWPAGHGFAAILTHDVEGPEGVARVEQVIELERRHGFVSSWNFVAE